MFNKHYFVSVMLLASLSMSNIAFATSYSKGTLGGTYSYSGKITKSDQLNSQGIFLTSNLLGILSERNYCDIYAFTAAASGEIEISYFWASVTKGRYAVSYNVRLTGDHKNVNGSIGGNGGNQEIYNFQTHKIRVTKGSEYSVFISATDYDDQEYKFTIKLPGTTPNNDGGNISGGNTIVASGYTTVKFYANGGTLYEEDHFGTPGYTSTDIASPCVKSIQYGKVLLPFAPSCRAPSGYKFAGWYTKSSGGTKISDSYTVPASDLQLYAQWHKKIEVKFDVNGGYGTLGPQIFYSSEPKALLLNSGKVKRTGSAFKGWKESDKNVIYADGAIFSPTSDTTLYAVWEATGVTVTFDEGGDVGEGRVGLYTSGEKYGTLPTPESRDGYDFVGWFTQDGYQVTKDSIVPKYDIKLCARWNRIETPWFSPVSYSGMSRFDVPNDEPDWYIRACELPMIISGVFTSETTTYRNDYIIKQSLNNIIFEPTVSGYYSVYFNSEVDYANERERRTLAIEFSDGSSSLGELESSGTMGLYLQGGEQYCIYFKMAGDCEQKGSGSNSFNIQIGGTVPQISYINPPGAPTAVIEDGGVRVSWNAVQGATKYYLYRRRQAVYTGKAGESSPGDYEFIRALTATTYFDNSLPHGFATDYYILAGKEGAISGASRHSQLVTAKSHFSLSANEIELPWNAREGFVTVSSDAFWTSSVEWLGDENDEACWGLDFGFLNSVKGDVIVPIRFNSDNANGRDRVWRVDFNITGIENAESLIIRQRARGNDVQITFMEKAGSSSRTYSEGETYDDLPTPESAGHTFVGWSNDEDGGGYVMQDMLASADTTELYPQWRPNTYTIRFDANGGSGTMPNQTVTYDTGWQFAKCKFSKAGSAFLGWATAPDGTVLYGDETDGENLSVVDGAVVDLYAVWGDAARYYGPWGYDPEPVKDDAAVSTLANISMSINGAEMAEGDVVAAYDSRGRLRAIGKAASVNGRLGASLSMNATVGTELMFLLWKYGGQTSDICVADTWIVAPAPGTVDHGELRLAGTLETKIPFRHCQISLTSVGWHLVSFSALPNDPSPAAAFVDVADKIDQVVQGSKVWKPATGGRLTKLEVGVGYWVRTKEDNVVWTLGGLSNPGVEIALSKGWNLVGYPLPASGSPAIVLKTAYGAGKFTQIVDGSKVYPGRLDALEPGKGYWVYAPAACTIAFDQN